MCQSKGEILFFLTKVNDIHSFKLMEYIDIIQIQIQIQKG